MAQPNTINRARGDTYPIEHTCRDDNGVAIDLAGSAVLLTVSSEHRPSDTTAQVFQMVATIANAAAGEVTFTPTATQAANVGRYYHDIQVTDSAGVVRTVAHGGYNVVQDITKASYHLWTAEGKTAADGSEGIYVVANHANDTWQYTTQGSTPVLQVTFSDNDAHIARYLVPTDWPAIDFTKPFEISGLAYMDESWWDQATITNAHINAGYLAIGLDNEAGARDCWVWAVMPDATTQIPGQSNYDYGPNETWGAGWVQFVTSWDPTTGAFGMRAWQPPGESDTGVNECSVTTPMPFSNGVFVFGMSSNAIGVAQVAWLKLELAP
jgi:hypothetical protein